MIRIVQIAVPLFVTYELYPYELMNFINTIHAVSAALN
jgi:hypothetical protein